MKKFKSKALIFSAVCTGMLLCGGTAYGETVDVSELTADKTITEDSVITGTNEAFNHTITISGDITVKLQNVSITSQSAGTASPITCADTTNGAKLLISEGTNTVKAIETSEMLQTGKGMAAINIPMGETLIIEADEQYPNATLYATGAVGIGGSHSIGSSDNYTSMGNLTINSGT